jgi:hypothetical protein
MRNMYPGKCLVCGKHIGKGEGFFQKVNKGGGKLFEQMKGRWATRCLDCVGKGNNVHI